MHQHFLVLFFPIPVSQSPRLQNSIKMFTLHRPLLEVDNNFQTVDSYNRQAWVKDVLYRMLITWSVLNRCLQTHRRELPLVAACTFHGSSCHSPHPSVVVIFTRHKHAVNWPGTVTFTKPKPVIDVPCINLETD